MSNETSTGESVVSDPANASGSGSSSSGGEPETIKEGINEIVQILVENEILLLGLIAVAGLLYVLYKKYEKKVSDEDHGYEGKDWNKVIPSEMKKELYKTGFESDKELTRGDFKSLGKVFRHDTEMMPKGMEYQELLFGDLDKNEIEDTETVKVHVFLVDPDGAIGKGLWKLTDLYLGMNSSTTIYVVSDESVTEERGRFKLDQDIDFKMEYGNIMMEKTVETENVTDQFPLYQTRKNILEGLEEFSHKTLMLDRQHASKIAELREDVDEEAIRRLLQGGSNF